MKLQNIAVKKIIFGLVAAVVIICAGLLWKSFSSRQRVVNPGHAQLNTDPKKSMQISSVDFAYNGNIPTAFTCDAAGGNVLSPQLSFLYVPAKAKSLVLMVDDPLAPGGNYNHWLLWNMRPDLPGIVQGSIPDSAVVGTNSAGKNGYAPLCPPIKSFHQYEFKLYALDTLLSLKSSSKRADVINAMNGHIIDQAVLVGGYRR